MLHFVIKRTHLKKFQSLSVGVIVVNILFGDFFLIDRPPGIDNIGEHEGHEQRDVEHGAQGELRGARVSQRERRLQVGR